MAPNPDRTELDPPSRHQVEVAAKAIDGIVVRTPVVVLADPTNAGRSITFKLEQLQHSGSFKARGAAHFIETQPIGAAGVVAASGGNHGAAVAWAAQRAGHPATIFVPTISSPAKVAKLRSYGATIHQVGSVYAEALEESEGFVAETGATPIHAYEDPAVMAGAGSVAVEFDQQAGPLDSILVATGGGGLAGGMACYLEGRTRLVICETEGTRAYAAAVEAGGPARVEISGVASDALGASRIGTNPWRALSAVGAVSAVVTDDDVISARRWLWDRHQIVVEHSAATALAALTSGVYQPEAGERIGVLLCGANTPIEL